MTSQTKGHADPEHSTPKPINPENIDNYAIII